MSAAVDGLMALPLGARQHYLGQSVWSVVTHRVPGFVCLIKRLTLNHSSILNIACLSRPTVQGGCGRQWHASGTHLHALACLPLPGLLLWSRCTHLVRWCCALLDG